LQPAYLHAQNSQVTGRILSSRTNESLPNVNVYISDFQLGSATDQDGRFVVYDVPLERIVLEISNIGYHDTSFVYDINREKFDVGEIFLKPEIIHFEEINVEIHTDLNPSKSPSGVVLAGKEIQEKMTGSIAQTLRNEMNVAMQSMGQGTTRPVLRGYSGDRFLMTENGTEIGDLSQTSVDHAVSMDLGGVEQIEIVRGPRTLLFGSNTISGVINIKKNTIPVVEFDHMHRYLTSGYESGNRGFFNSVSVVTPIKKNNLRFSLNNRRAGNQQTPLGILKNTSLNTIEGFIGLTRFKDHQRGTISMENITMDYGIPGSAEGHISGVDMKMDKTTQKFNYHRDIAFNGFETLDVDQKFVHYSHSEFELNQKNPSVILGQDIFLIQTKMTGLKRELGGSIQYRRFKAGGFYWTPNTTESNFSIFGFRERKFFGLTGQGAFRGEYSIVNPEDRPDFSNIDSNDVNRKKYSFISLSGALIRSWKKWQFSTTLMSVGRTPGIEDLFSDGPHLGSYSYEIGNPNLALEKTIGIETSLQYKGNRLSFMMNGFLNNSPNFHQYTQMGECEEPFVLDKPHPCAGADFIEWGSGPSGWLYKYQMIGLKSQISGGEVQLTYYGKRLDITTDFSFVRGIDTSNQNHLSYMPADKLKILFSTKTNQDLTGTLRFTKGFRQNKISEFETITPGHFLIDIFGSYSFNAFNSSHRLIFQLNNLLDETYYNHLSKIKLIMPESGRSINLQYRYLF
tara:strand:- start:4324 stop:6534 length:2211 start_codon:yes stop_codon:yes gene_type:complete